MRRMISWTAALLVGACCATASAQDVRVQDARTGADRLEAAVGDTIDLDVVVDLGALPATGVALYLAVPADGLQWLAGDRGPFQLGALFDGAVEFANGPLAADDTWGLGDDELLLNLAVVMGPGTADDRARSGEGVLASLRAVCTAPLQETRVGVVSNAVHHSFFVLADGRSERDVVPAGDLQLSAQAPAGAPVARAAGGSWGRLKRRHR